MCIILHCKQCSGCDNIIYDDDINISDLGVIEEPADSQLISLDMGYQFVSSYLEFDDPDMEFLLDDIFHNLDFVRNSGSFMLRKIGPVWVNSIGAEVGVFDGEKLVGANVIVSDNVFKVFQFHSGPGNYFVRLCFV